MTPMFEKSVHTRHYRSILAIPILLNVMALILLGIGGQGAAAEPTTAPSTTRTTGPANAATGTWDYVIHIEDLDVHAIAELTQSDTKITGTVKAGEDLKGLDITDGKIESRDISFTLDRVLEQGTLESKYSGKIEGEKIEGTIEIFWVNRDNSTTKVAWHATRMKAGK